MAIYFIRSGLTNAIKIGFTEGDPKRRLKELATGSSDFLEAIGSRAGGKAEERAMHDRFRPWHIRGEWFRMNPELAVEVALCSPEFARLAAVEPMLCEIARTCGTVGRVDGTFCANAVWFGYDRPAIRDDVSAVVGFMREKPPEHLRTSEAYDLVTDTLYNLLPPCRGCGCLTTADVEG